MNIKDSIMLCMTFGVIVAIVSCSTTGQTEEHSPTIKANATSDLHNVVVKQDASTTQPIRLVDFANFTYPWVSDLGDPRKSFALQNGKLAETRDRKGMIDKMGVILEKVAYGNVTGNGTEEALVVLSIATGGSAIPHANYIYTLQAGKPKLLWAFSTGDRADGGLRQVYAENGDLVIERYSPVESKGDCCPTHFTRTRYEWQSNHFQQKGAEDVLPNPEGHGSPIM